MRCPVCGAENPPAAEYCEACQQAMAGPPPRKRGRKVRRCPECGARMGQWDTVCVVCEATVNVVPMPSIPLPASVLVGVMALLLLAFAAWAYQPWSLLAALPTPTRSALGVVTPTPAAAITPTSTGTNVPAIVSTPRTITVTHTVQQGETLISIAKQYGTTVEAIMKANDLISLAIYVGQELLIPVPPDGAPTPTPRRRPVVHVVQPGEYLEIIAERYGVTVRAIKEANGLTSDVIYPGQELVIPVPAAPASS
jgi:LysM repeat protein